MEEAVGPAADGVEEAVAGVVEAAAGAAEVDSAAAEDRPAVEARADHGDDPTAIAEFD